MAETNMLHTTNYSTEAVLTPTPPFAFAQSVRFLEGFPPTQGEQEFATKAITKAIRIEGQTVGFRVKTLGSVTDPLLQCRLYASAPIDDALQTKALNRIAFFLSLDDDLCSFYALGRADEEFRPILERCYGLHQVKFLTPFENACWAVLAQRCPLPVGQSMKQKLTAAYGGHLTIEDTTHPAFPSANDFGEATENDLRRLIGNVQKADRLWAVIQAFQTVEEQWLQTGPYDAVRAWLLDIHGIGPWSAAFVLLRGLGHMAHLQGAERHLKPAAERVYGPLTEPGFRQLAECYGAHRGYWMHYLKAADIG